MRSAAASARRTSRRLMAAPSSRRCRPWHPGRVQSTLCGRPVAGDRALIMAIVNRTPDSFYDRGATFTDAAAKAAAHRAVDQGADVIDVGGVKAGPGQAVDADEEIARVVPFIEWLRGAYPQQLISVDTWRATVAKQACAAGADLINDSLGRRRPRTHAGCGRVRRRAGVLTHGRGRTANAAVPGELRPHRARRRRRCDRRGHGRRRAGGRGRRRAREDPDRPDPRFRQEHVPRARIVAPRGRSC